MESFLADKVLDMGDLKPIRINMNQFKDRNNSLYRVYTAPGQFKLTEADTAHEAYTKSGLSSVFKIEKESFYRYIALKSDQMEATEKTFETNPELPDPADIKSVLMNNLDDFSRYDAEQIMFEEMTLADLRRAEVVLPSPEAMMAESLEEAVAIPAPETPAEAITEEVVAMVEKVSAEPAVEAEAAALTPEEVEALLKA